MQALLKYSRGWITPLVLLLFIVGDVYVLLNERYYFYVYNLIPVVLFVIYTAIFHLQQLVFLVAFATPLAIGLKEMGLTQGPDLSIPTEPLMIGMMFVYILNSFERRLIEHRFSRHPISVLILIQIVWMAITTLSSTDIVVSLKYLVSRLWFIFSCYIIVHHIFVNRSGMIRFIFSYAVAMAIVVAYTTVIHARFNFNDKAADWVVSPFYNDHTAYGAALAMFIPVMVAVAMMKSVSRLLRFLAVSLFIVFMVAIILSFARAGWLSLVVALGILATLMLRIKFRTIVLTLLAGAALFFAFQTEILLALGRNSTDAEGGFENNIESVSNISTDASNLERINRWSCAIRMWQDKPLLGWGPGTYMFKYAPYQLSRELTIISTNFGTNGNAHSEYLGPLSEQGVPGVLIVLVLLFYTTNFGYRLFYELADRQDRILACGIFLGIMTYFVHGFFNNFLDTDKLSLPFWGFLAAMVCFDLYFPKKPKKGITGISGHS